METTNTNISPWLHSIQHTFRTNELFTTIDDSVSRIGNTRKKINSILNTLYGLEEKLGVNLTSYRERMHDMIAIRDAIGVYGIYHDYHSRRQHPHSMLWWKEQLSYERTLPNKEGNEWFDYFGKDDGITNVGGYVVVSLSGKGIEYLNSISEKVSYWSSSPDKRYYTTVTI
jgi:hypothetical protein